MEGRQNSGISAWWHGQRLQDVADRLQGITKEKQLGASSFAK
jgi:hypothetical protein